MPDDNQLQGHRGQKEDKGDIPRDSVVEVIVVDFRVTLLNRFVDGIVGELGTNRLSVETFTCIDIPPNLVSFRIQMKAIQKVRAQGPFIFPSCFPNHSPDVSHGDPFFLRSLCHSLSIQLCERKLPVALPWGIPRH